MKNLNAVVIVSTLLFSGQSSADINFSGFASINAGRVLSGEGVPQFDLPPTFLADYPIVSAYEEEWSFKPESLFGLQVSADLADGLSVTGQLVSRGADDFSSKLEWAYMSYEINDHWTVQAGKKRLPLFYYSDFYDVGYAYVWMRPPSDTYTWQVFNYNGINALYTGEIGNWSVSGNIYLGSEDSNNNRLLSKFFFAEPTREIWKDILGGVVNFSNDWFEIRLTHMRYTNERERSGVPTLWNGSTERDGRFYGLAMNADWGKFFVLTELNRLDLDGNSDTGMVSMGYRMDKVTPYIGYARFKEDLPDGENHNSTFIGLRWDFHNSAAFKIQYDDVEDNSFDLAVAGDSRSLTLGIDLVF